MAASSNDSTTRFCLKIKGFKKVAEKQQCPPLQLKDALIKEIRDTFTKQFQDPAH